MEHGAPYFNRVQDDEPLQPGDIIAWGGYGHSMLYLGTDPETGKHVIGQTCGGWRVIGIDEMVGIPDAYKGKQITPEQIRSWGGETSPSALGGGIKYAHVSRLKPEILDPNWTIPEMTRIQWPNGMVTQWNGEVASTQIDPNVPVWYDGIAGKVGGINNQIPWWEKIAKAFSDFANYIIGLISMVLRIPLIGWANVAEGLVTWAVEVVSTEPIGSTLTLEKIIFNQVPIFDVNIFNLPAERSRKYKCSLYTKTSSGWLVYCFP